MSQTQSDMTTANKRIGIFAIYEGQFTGGVRVALSLAVEMMALGHTPIVITNVKSPLTESCDEHGVQYELLPPHDSIDQNDGDSLRGGPVAKMLAAFRLFQFNLKFRQCLRKHRVEIVWCRNIKTTLMSGLACRWQGIPLIWDIGMEKKSVGMVKLLHGIGFRLADRVVTEGKSVQTSTFHPAHLERYADKLMVIASGIPRERVLQIREANNRSKADCQSTDNERDLTLLSVATINDRKNQLMLLAAAKEIIAEIPDVKFLIAGPVVDEDYGQKVDKYIEDNQLANHVECLGWRKDVEQLLASSDMFLLTSRVEGVPYSILEAMHAGVPVVATAAGGVPDVVVSGKTGFVVEIDNLNQFVESVLTCLRDKQLRNQIAQNAKELVTREYSVDSWVKNYNQLFEKLVSQ